MTTSFGKTVLRANAVFLLVAGSGGVPRHRPQALVPASATTLKAAR
jgi:hypothetical protein